VPLLILMVLVPLALLALMPLILIQRYRAGAARRMARPWMATLNVVLMMFSAICFLAGAAVTSVWVPNALTGAAAGLTLGAGLGLIGRVLYGMWRSWTVAEAGVHGTPMVLAFGIPESLAAGGR